jgi:group II intron reverse transcriptase/maturase
MIERVLKGRNIKQAIRQTVSNKGASGVDKMPVSELKEYFKTHQNELFTNIINHKYKPQAIRGVGIPKPNGKTRLLGVPTVIDRTLQQAVSQAIMPLFEMDFHENSYGFRPQKNAHQAIHQSKKFIELGYKKIVEIDLKSFFDEVDHAILLQLIYRKVKCPTTLRLIRIWLKAPILINGKLTKRRNGTPQGSPLSPLLSNILLNELDKFLTMKGQKFVRYADDFSIYCKGKLRAQEIGNQVYLFLKNKLKLPINREKSGIRSPATFSILGHGFTSSFEKGSKNKYQFIVLEKSWKKLKASIKEITRKTTPSSFDERIRKLKVVQRGWLNYFKYGNIASKLKSLDGWIRNRLRYCIWTDWKKPERKRKNLIRLGVPYGKAYAFSRTRKGGWAIAQSPILTTTITLARLHKRGYESMSDYFEKVNGNQTPLFD